MVYQADTDLLITQKNSQKINLNVNQSFFCEFSAKQGNPTVSAEKSQKINLNENQSFFCEIFGVQTKSSQYYSIACLIVSGSSLIKNVGNPSAFSQLLHQQEGEKKCEDSETCSILSC